MRVMVTGHLGYIGTVLVPMLRHAGHIVGGIDNGLYYDRGLAPPAGLVADFRCDIRDIGCRELQGFDAVIHLAGISNDPLGDLNPACTLDINYNATRRLADVARTAGVTRFLFASSCSVYGASEAADVLLDEEAAFHPVTPYGESKVLSESALLDLAASDFHPTFLRCATVYGDSPMLRADLVVNNLVAYALFTGQVLLKSDGTAWRPLIHVDDVCRAYLAVLTAPVDRIHARAFNVGCTEENFQVREVAERVASIVPYAEVRFAAGASADARCYRVDCGRIHRALPEFRPHWTLDLGIAQLLSSYRTRYRSLSDLLGPTCLRIARVKELLETGTIDDTLRWQVNQHSAA